MTRINCIPVEELTDKHLLAEYRELPRLFALVLQAQQRGEVISDKRNPTKYVLGAGHVRFFYPRLGYISKRFHELVAACKDRGWNINHDKLPDNHRFIEKAWFGDWTPTKEAIELNRERINLRLREAAERNK